MTCYNERRSFLEFLLRKPGVSFSELAETPGMEEAIRDTFDDLQRSKEELREREAALRARNEELETYAHMVAHDLKDPLAVVVITSDLIADIPDLTRRELKEHMQQIRSTAYEMNKIIDNLLLLALVQKAEVPVEPVDMDLIVANVRDRLSVLIKEHRARIGLPEVWPEAIGYAPWIEEVWANLFSNALKHGGRPPRIELGASPQPDGTVRFWMSDNGPGLPPDVLGRLFTPFNHTAAVRASGHGLGLSIVHQIVEKLGGQVGVESESGKGSLFFFTLPASPSSRQQNLAPVMRSNSAPEATWPG